MSRNPNVQTPKPPLRLSNPIPIVRPRYEYTTLSAERPLTAAQLDSYGVDGWRVAGVYVRFDAVHVIFEREVIG